MNSKKILVIDDENSMQRLLKVSLESDGYTVESVKTGNAGVSVASSHPELCAIILDLGLPDLNGIEVLKKIRAFGITTPIIVLTVMDDDDSKVGALDAGADDYLTKPFSVPELLARIRVAMRHSDPQSADIKTIRAGELEIDIQAHQIRARGTEIKVTPIEFQILTLLGHNLGKVVTHSVLLNKIWGPNSVDHVQYLRVHLGQIRKKLKAHQVDGLLVTESGVGYRLLSK